MYAQFYCPRSNINNKIRTHHDINFASVAIAAFRTLVSISTEASSSSCWDVESTISIVLHRNSTILLKSQVLTWYVFLPNQNYIVHFRYRGITSFVVSPFALRNDVLLPPTLPVMRGVLLRRQTWKQIRCLLYCNKINC